MNATCEWCSTRLSYQRVFDLISQDGDPEWLCLECSKEQPFLETAKLLIDYRNQPPSHEDWSDHVTEFPSWYSPLNPDVRFFDLEAAIDWLVDRPITEIKHQLQ